MTDFNVVLFDDFETLDAFGPAEMLGTLENEYAPGYFSCNGGIVTSTQGVPVQTRPLGQMPEGGVVLVPGGMGTRTLVHNNAFVAQLRAAAASAAYVLTVCTGSALLAKTGLLNGKRATSNKKAFAWVQSVNQDVRWVKKARWVADGNFYTSSGVSAGMDMALGFIADRHGLKSAQTVADLTEYVWNANSEADPFCTAL